jgi:hypothetical protein
MGVGPRGYIRTGAGGRADAVDVRAPLLDSRDWFGPIAAVPVEDVKRVRED